jgi:hypothetical protein
MFFTDGQDAGAGLNDFLSNFGSGAVEHSPLDASPEPDSQDGAPLTDTAAPETPDDGQDFSATDLVADRLAASLAEDGVEIPEPGEEEEAEDEGPVDFENLTPEEIKALAKEALSLKEKESQASEEATKSAVWQKIATAQDEAAADVERAFEAEVLSKSANHYTAELNRRLATVVREAKNQDNPDAYVIQNAIAVANLIFEARREYEATKAQEWGAVAEQARREAALTVPELREYHARQLMRTYNLPEEALADLTHPNRHIQNFEHRAKELQSLAQTLGTERQKQKLEKQKAANRELQRNPVRTSPTGKLPAGKPREWKDLSDSQRAEAGAAWLHMNRG